jgi:colanic acid/amylovoran biosynthesis protein
MNDRNLSRLILITNIVSLNTGDAAILWGMFEVLRQRYGPNTRFVVFDRSAKAARKYYPWATFRQSLFTNKPEGWLSKKLELWGYGHWNQRLRYWLLRFAALLIRIKAGKLASSLLKLDDFESVNHYVQADLVISSGGTYLIENYGLWPPIYDYRLTFSAGTPLIFYTQTMGPFRNPKYRFAFTDIFNRATAIFLRDERSRQHLIDLGINQKKITLAKDAAFVIEPTNDKLKTSHNQKLNISGPFTIAVSVRSLNFFSTNDPEMGNTYKACVAEMVSMAVSEFGAQVVFISTCQGISDYWTDDSLVADRIYEILSPSVQRSVSVDRDFRQPIEIVDEYEKFDLVIATRMHSAILSLVSGTPVLGIAYEFKLEDLFHQLGMSEFCLSIKSMDSDKWKKCLRAMLNNLEGSKKRALEIRNKCYNESMSVVGKLPDL